MISPSSLMMLKEDYRHRPLVAASTSSALFGCLYVGSWRRFALLICLGILVFYVLSMTLAWSFSENFNSWIAFGTWLRSRSNDIDANKNRAALINAWVRNSQPNGDIIISQQQQPSSEPPRLFDNNNNNKKTNTMMLNDDDLDRLSPNETEQLRRKALRFFFAPKMTPNERKMLLDTLKVCLNMIEQVGLSYFIYGGTLIGYYRHNASLIPWDDDADIALLTRSEAEVRSYITKMEAAIKAYPGYALTYVHRHRRFKCFGNTSNNSFVIDTWRQWRWPFIDLQFMREISNGTRPGANKIVQDYSATSFYYPDSAVYPLKRAVFTEDHIPVYVPFNVTAVVTKNYKMSECRSASGYDHRRERPTTTIISVDCSALTFVFNFTNMP